MPYYYDDQYSGHTAGPPYYSRPSTQYSSSYGPPQAYSTSPAMSYSHSSQSNSSSGSSYNPSQGTISPSQLYLSNPYESSHYLQSAPQTYNMPASTSSSKGSSSKAEKSYPCLVSGCLSAAKGAKFTRAADLDRHVKTVHCPTYTDCPHAWCGRTGSNGFSRKDHLNEHLKQMHMGVPIPQKKK